MGELVRVDALGPGGPYRSAAPLGITDVAGTPVAELDLVPRVFAARAVSALRRTAPLPPAERVAALTAAGAAFEEDVVSGLSPQDYQHLVSRVAGTPLPVVRSATRYLAGAARGAGARVAHARPAGVVDGLPAGSSGGAAMWVRRGGVLGVVAAGNHPAVHGPWLEALALGYRVAVRPSRREPFTPHRMVTALREAGFGPDRVALLPSDHAGVDALVELADLVMIYGGDEVVRRHRADPTVLPQGPGRSKVLLASDVDWRAHLDTVVESVAGEGGAACTNATAVFVEGDPAPVAEALAQRLAEVPSLAPDHDRAALPVHAAADAHRIAAVWRRHATAGTAWLGGDGVVDELGDGSAVLRPAVVQLDRAAATQAGVELGFPCVWVLPWSRADGIAPLRPALTLTACTRDRALIELLVDEPTIANVHIGDHPTSQIEPHLPHDGYLPEFLMRTKTVLW